MATWQLDAFLRQFETRNRTRFPYAEVETTPIEAPKPQTVAGIGPGTWDRNRLANSQGQAAYNVPAKSSGSVKTLYRLFTQDINRNATLDIIRRYFEGATVTYGVGLDSRTQEHDENAVIISIVTSKADAFQRIVDLAGDIRVRNNQISVLVTQQSVTTFEVTETTATKGTL